MSHKTAASAYGGTAQRVEMSGFEVTAELYKGMVRFIGQAKEAYKIGRLDEMCNLITKVNKILIALQSNINFDEGGQAAVFLNAFYTDIFAKLFKVLQTPDPEASFDQVLEDLRPMVQLWESHAANAKQANPDTHVAMPDLGGSASSDNASK